MIEDDDCSLEAGEQPFDPAAEVDGAEDRIHEELYINALKQVESEKSLLSAQAEIEAEQRQINYDHIVVSCVHDAGQMLWDLFGIKPQLVVLPLIDAARSVADQEVYQDIRVGQLLAKETLIRLFRDLFNEPYDIVLSEMNQEITLEEARRHREVAEKQKITPVEPDYPLYIRRRLWRKLHFGRGSPDYKPKYDKPAEGS